MRKLLCVYVPTGPSPGSTQRYKQPCDLIIISTVMNIVSTSTYGCYRRIVRWNYKILTYKIYKKYLAVTATYIQVVINRAKIREV